MKTSKSQITKIKSQVSSKETNSNLENWDLFGNWKLEIGNSPKEAYGTKS